MHGKRWNYFSTDGIFFNWSGISVPVIWTISRSNRLTFYDT